jgi:hypothetical protein
MRALIDGDLLPYEFGGLKVRSREQIEELGLADTEVGDPLPMEMCWAALQNRIQSILDATNADQYTIYLSSSEIPTWRYDTATILPYKGNRQGQEKPYHYDTLKMNLINTYNTEEVEFNEADDAISMAQYADMERVQGQVCAEEFASELNTVICSRDKDLNMVPGWHYSWPSGRSPEKPMWFQTKVEGLRCFYKQLLTGDPTDNILGLHGVGPKSKLITYLDECNTEWVMFNHVLDCYRQRFGNYALKFMTENGQLLWMMDTPDPAKRWSAYNMVVRHSGDVSDEP